MAKRESSSNSLQEGLQQLVAGAFPKRCRACGRVYRDFPEFLSLTDPMYSGSGLKEVTDDGGICVEVYRNCRCGSTLMDVARDRRDESEAGRRHREKFDLMVRKLVAAGIERRRAREELLSLLHGGSSEVIAELLKRAETKKGG